MADFGDYAGNYLTMVSQQPQNVDRMARLGEFIQDERLKRPLQREKAKIAPELAMSELYGTPFDRWKSEWNVQDVVAKQNLAKSSQDRLYAADEENRRRNTELERYRIKTQADANAIARWNAAKTAYDAGLGPDPGPTPGSQPGADMQAGGGVSGAAQTNLPQRPPIPEDLQRLPPGMRNKIMAERMAERPQALTKIEGLTTTLDQMIEEARQLQEHDSIVSGSGWTGTVMRNTPDFTEKGARNFGERLKSLGAQIGFNALSQMREMSKTGGALGQVSDFENRRLEAAISALDAMQSPDDIKRGLRQVTNYANAAKKNMAAAYKRTYGEDMPAMEKREVVPPSGGGAATSELTATGPNGEKIVFRNGQWQPIR